MTTIVCANPLCRQDTRIKPGDAEQVLLFSRRDVSPLVPIDSYFCADTLQNRLKLSKLYAKHPDLKRRSVPIVHDDCFDVSQVLDLVINDYRVFKTSNLLNVHIKSFQRAAIIWETRGRQAAYQSLMVRDKPENVRDCDSCEEGASKVTYSIPTSISSPIRMLTTRIQDLVDQATSGADVPMTSEFSAFLRREEYSLLSFADRWQAAVHFIREQNQSLRKSNKQKVAEPEEL